MTDKTIPKQIRWAFEKGHLLKANPISDEDLARFAAIEVNHCRLLIVGESHGEAICEVERTDTSEEAEFWSISGVATTKDGVSEDSVLADFLTKEEAEKFATELKERMKGCDCMDCSIAGEPSH